MRWALLRKYNTAIMLMIITEIIIITTIIILAYGTLLGYIAA